MVELGAKEDGEGRQTHGIIKITYWYKVLVNMCVCVWVSMYVPVYICVYVLVRVWVCGPVCWYGCMFVYARRVLSQPK